MGTIATRPVVRWLVPIALIGAIALIATMTAIIRNGARTSLPPRSAASLLVGLATSNAKGLSGTVVERADLGLPALPSGIGGDGSADWAQLLTGSHTLRVWTSGPSMSRVALLGSLGESDIVRNGQDVWTWSSRDNAASHLRLPAASALHTENAPRPGGSTGSPPTIDKVPGVMPLPSGIASLLPGTPEQALNAILGILDKTTSVTNAGGVTVAGRPAYQLAIAPRDAASLVASIRIDVDSAEYVPLRLRVFARGYAKPAYEIGFTQVSFDQPDPELFRFEPPEGAKVTQVPGPSGTDSTGPAQSGNAGTPQVTVAGSGWSTVLGVRAGVPMPRRYSDYSPGDTGSAAGLGAVVGKLPRVSGAWGSGRLMATKLLTVLITDDGRLYVGAVTPSTVYAAAGSSTGWFRPGGAPDKKAPAQKAPAKPTPSPAHT